VAGGRLEEAFHLLEEALPMHAEVRAAAATNPEFAPLKANPRFRAMLKE
jgi:hypothetical protein